MMQALMMLCIFIASVGTMVAQSTFSSSVKSENAGRDCNQVSQLSCSVSTESVVTVSWEAPRDLIIEEGFENGIPSSWLNIDSDGDGYLWMEAPYGAPHSGTGMATSESYYNGNLTPDNWLITDPITLSGSPTLNFWVNAQTEYYANEHYGVYISTTGTNLSDFTLLFEETLIAKSGIATGERNRSDLGNRQGNWYERTVDISNYSGTVYLAWRHFNCVGMDRLNLDDIVIDSHEPVSDLIGYKVYCDNNLVATLDNSTTTYAEENTEIGTHEYCVTAVYTNCESDQECASIQVFDPESCLYSVVMHKNTGPTGIGGWEGASIRFFAENGDMLANVTLEEGDNDTEILPLPNDEEITCIWFDGANDYWIRFELVDPTGNIFYSCWPDSLSNSQFLTFQSSCSAAIPEAPESLTVEGNFSVLEATLSWVNPSLNIDGTPTTLTSVVVLRNDEPIYTIENPIAGATETWTDVEIPLPGIYTYGVFAVNAEGAGETISDFDTVGQYRVLPTYGTESMTTCAGLIVNDVTEIGLYPEYNGSITIYPETEGAFVSIHGIHYIYGGEMGGSPDYLNVYDGVGMDGLLLNSYTASCFDKGRGVLNDVSISGPLTIHFITNGGGGCRGFEIYTECTEKAELSGIVTDNNGDFVEGAIVEIASGVTATTDELGHYSVLVSEGTYDITFLASGYSPYIENNYEMGTEPQILNAVLEISQLCEPVQNLTADLNSENVPVLAWELPSGQNTTLSWSGEYDGNSIGTGSAIDFDCAHRFTTNDILEYAGWTLTKIAFVPCEPTASFSLRAWTGSTPNLVLDQSVEQITSATWNEFSVETSVTIQEGEEFWIGYHVVTETGFPAGIDNNPVVEGKGNMMYYNGSWTTLSSLGDFQNNWCIVATITSQGRSVNITLKDGERRPTIGNLTKKYNAVAEKSAFGTKEGPAGSLIGYNIYRNAELLEIVNVDVLTYTDETAAEGTHEYCVTAVYENCESEALCKTLTISDMNELESMFNIYPNPANDQVTIEGENIESISVYNVLGQLIDHISVTETQKTVNATEYNAGIYVFRIITHNGNVISKRVVINH